MKFIYAFSFSDSEYDTLFFKSDKQALPLDLKKGERIYFGAIPQEFIDANSNKEDLLRLIGGYKFRGKSHSVETTGFETSYSFKAIR